VCTPLRKLNGRHDEHNLKFLIEQYILQLMGTPPKTASNAGLGTGGASRGGYYRYAEPDMCRDDVRDRRN